MGIEYGRPAGAGDWRAIRDICCRTAEGGRGIPEERRPFFEEFWVAPYERLAPDWAFVARDGGRVIAYLTGCPATAPFFLRRHFLLRWPLFFRALSGFYGASPDAAGFARRFAFLKADPGRRLGLKFLGGILTVYPAHLHVNVSPDFHGRGVGRRLMELCMMELRRARVPGVHLVCGQGPVGFYAGLGFQELARTRISAEAELHAMGLILA